MRLLSRVLIAYLIADEEKARTQRENRVTCKRLDLETFTDAKCKIEFRFTLSEIKRMCNCMKFSPILSFKSEGNYNIHVPCEFAFALVLYRYAFPRQYCSMEMTWGMDRSSMKAIVNQFSLLLLNKFKYGLEFDICHLSLENCERFAKAILDKTNVYPNVIGFMEGSMQKICPPARDGKQSFEYDGCRSIATPDGITSLLVGPFVESSHGAKVFDKSKTLDRVILHLELISSRSNSGVQFAVYGDQSYTVSKNVYRPFNSYETANDPIKVRMNKKMSRAKVQVELDFSKVGRYFKYCMYDFGIKSKGNTKPAMVCILSILFKNFHTCLNGSATATMFGIKPPTIEEYITGLMRERHVADTIDSAKTILDNSSNLIEI